MQVRKRFGQHFLHDPAVLQRIVQAVDPKPGEHVVEIGPGQGALTALLLSRAGHVDAVEIDRDLAALLRQRWPETLTLHQADALKFDQPFIAHVAERGAHYKVLAAMIALAHDLGLETIAEGAVAFRATHAADFF